MLWSQPASGYSAHTDDRFGAIIKVSLKADGTQ